MNKKFPDEGRESQLGKLTLDALEVIDAIDRKGSFAAAAAALYRVPSALTYSVQKLEEELGVTLFRREGRRSVLTPAGRTLLEQGRDLLEAADRLVETTRQVHHGWESQLNIAIDSILDGDFLWPLLARFYDANPDIEINLFEEVLGGSWEAVMDGRADLAVGASEAPAATPGLRQRALRSAEWVFAVAPGHPLAECTGTMGEAEIAAHRAVVVRDSSRKLPPLTRRVFDSQALLRVQTMQQKIDAQLAGLGVGFLPKHRIASLLESGRLRAIDVDPAIESVALHMVWKTGNRGRALRWFIEELQKQDD